MNSSKHDETDPGMARDVPRLDGRVVFERHVLALGDELMRRARRMTGDEADAEDLVQETLLKALTAVHTLEDPGRARAWVHAIMHNTFASLCRANARRSAVPLDHEELDCLESRVPRRRADIAFDIERAFAGLERRFREAVLMCDVEGLSYEEAAGSMGCPVGTLMSRLSRARSKLRAALN